MRTPHEVILLAALVACGRRAEEPSPVLEMPPALGAPHAIGPDRPSSSFGPWWQLDTMAVHPRHPDSAMVVGPLPHSDSVMVVVPPPHPDTVMVHRWFGAPPHSARRN